MKYLKKLAPLIIICLIIVYGIFESYKKKLEKNPEIINFFKKKQ